MVREIVVYRDAPDYATDFQPTPNAFEARQAPCDALWGEANGGADSQCRQRVSHIEGPHHRQRHGRHTLACPQDVEHGPARLSAQPLSTPVGIAAQAECLDATARQGAQTERFGIVCAQQQQPPARDQTDKPPERQPDRLEVRIDVGMIEFDVIHHDDVRQVLEKLGGLVEKRAVVFIAFNDELRSVAESIAGAEVPGDPANHETRIAPTIGE